MGMKQPFEKVVEQHGGTVLRVCRVLLGVHDARGRVVGDLPGGDARLPGPAG